MNNNNHNKLYLIVGPSGSGKSTLAAALKKYRIPEVISHTTRDPRVGEIDGVNYHYISRDHFEEISALGGFIEEVEYNGNRYGSTFAQVEALLALGPACIVVEGHGAEQFHKALPGRCVGLFLRPPSDEDLRKRLEGRGDSVEGVQRRMELKESEMIYAGNLDVIQRQIEPGTPQEVLESVLGIISTHAFLGIFQISP
jgi:guanylate kinase